MEQEQNKHCQSRCHSLGKFLAHGFWIVFLGFLGGYLAIIFAPKINRLEIPFLKFNSKQQSNAELSEKSERKKTVVEDDSAVVQTVEKSAKAVVSVVISQDVPKLQQMDGFFGFPFFSTPKGFQGGGGSSQGENTEKQTIGQGTGFLISSDGMIVTNKHVVSAISAEYTVITTDGKHFSAKVLARDPNKDIAVLKIETTDAAFLSFGNSDDIRVGQSVLAIGNSLGEFSNTVSKGIVSGLGRNLVASSGAGDSERLSNIIQTDAAINPGNSGGPLLNIAGEVIGVNVAMAAGAQSVGFALPVNQVKKIVDQVRSTGKITTPFLGIRYVMLNADIQKANALSIGRGALILRGDSRTDFAVIPGSPADKAGLVENDVIVKIDGAEVDESHQIADLIAEYQPGDILTLDVWHKGEMKSVKVSLEERK